VHHATRNVYNDLRDLANSHLLGSNGLRETPLGFSLVGSHSIHHRAMQAGTFEQLETGVLSACLSQADVFVDVGANIGFYTCLARIRGRHVVAIEPLPTNLRYLYANLEANRWSDVEVFPVGLADAPGLATLYGASSTGASLIGRWARANPRVSRKIALSTMDIVVGSRFSNRRVLVKVDVEGAEYRVLRGATTVLDSRPAPVWMVEICLDDFHPSGLNPDYMATFELFWARGYRSQTADGTNAPVSRADVLRWVGRRRADSGTINYIFRRD
jgi:FkbM family methyltransferase